MTTIIVPAPEAWVDIAERLLAELGESGVVLLEGELGAGKTSLVQAVCRSLGVTEPVTSPTFSIVNEYHFPRPDERTGLIFHMDLYRIEAPEELEQIGLEEYFSRGDYCFVEWPDVGAEFYPPNARRLRLEHLADSGRKILFL